MSRYIDADALEQIIVPMVGLWEDTEFYISYERVLDAIDNVPSIDMPQWIPCSEELPEIGENVLVKIEDDGDIRTVRTGRRFNAVDETLWIIDGFSCAFDDAEVVAWMPLPMLYENSERSE